MTLTQTDVNRIDMLHMAIKNQDHEVLSFIYPLCKQHIEHKDHLLRRSAEMGNAKAVELILEDLVQNDTVPDNLSYGMVRDAVTGGNMDCVRLLVPYFADDEDALGRGLLESAERGNVEATALLVDGAGEQYKKQAIDIAGVSHQSQVFDFLCNKLGVGSVEQSDVTRWDADIKAIYERHHLKATMQATLSQGKAPTQRVRI